MCKDLIEILPSFDVISFDIFDTLLLRPFVKPTDLFYVMERDEHCEGFAQARIAGEQRVQVQVRAAGRAEATLDEIYHGIPEWEKLKDAEIKAEKRFLTVNPEMLAVYEKAKSLGKKVIITSDMYMPVGVLQDILTSKGVVGWDGFYVSSECQLQKCTGTVYEKILNDVGVGADKILHIGDNNYSDVIRANEKGIVAYGYQKIIDKFYEECPFVKVFLGDGKSLGKRLFVGSMALGWHIYKCEHPDWTYWNRIGFLFAGALGYAYMRFVGESAKKHGFTRLMFVARDGYILQKIFNLLYPSIRTDYFYASRVQALLGIKYFGRTEIGIKVRRLYCIRYLEESLKVALTEDQKEKYEEMGILPDDAQKALDEVAQLKRSEAESYLSRFEINPRTTAIVDGDSTHFTVQKFVSAIVGHNVFTYYLFTNRPVENAETMACADWDMRYLHFAEFLFGAPTPPLEDIVHGKILYKKDLPFFEQFKVSCSSEISDGAVASATMLAKTISGFNHDTWLDWNDAFMDCVTCFDKEMFSLARNSIAIGHESGYQPILNAPEEPYRKTLFGRTFLLAQTKRHGVLRFSSLLLFGRISILELSLPNWNNLMGRVRRSVNFLRSLFK